MSTIAKPFGMLMMWLYNVTQNYGLAIILFAIIVRLIMLPFQMKSKRGMMRMSLVQPQMQELQKRYASNQQKLNEEIQKLYKEEGVNPMSGCLWSLIPFPILIALYEAIRKPLTCMMGVSESLIAEGGSIMNKLTELGFEVSARSGYAQIAMSKFISEHFSAFEGITSKLRQIDYSFLGIDLGETPDFKFWNFNWSDPAELAPALGLMLVPIVAAVLTYLTSYVSQKMNPQTDPNSAAQMNTMNLMMPLMTLWFAFMMPAALGLYWAMGSLLSIVQEIVLTNHYKKILAVETAEKDALRAKREAELEAKREETERLRAMNATVENENTSKKKREAREKAEAQRAADEWQRVKSGEEPEDEPSRVGHRKYARGRAYDPDRYTRTEEPENEGNDEVSGDNEE